MKRYVVGFMFTEGERYVLLLRKARPKWQAGLLNGVGGHVKEGEGFAEAMRREGLEEAGVVPRAGWELFAVLVPMARSSCSQKLALPNR